MKLGFVSFLLHSSTDLMLSQDKYRQKGPENIYKGNKQTIFVREMCAFTLINLIGELIFKI